MSSLENWVRIRIFNAWVWAAVNLLGAKVNRERIVKEYGQAPEFAPAFSCENCGEVVSIAGRPVHVSQLKAVEGEWVDRGIIR